MWKVNDTCYFVISNTFVEVAKVKRISGGFVMIQTEYGKTINLRETRLYHTEEEAKANCRQAPKKNQYDYMYEQMY